jgi:hypothetical protein
MSASGWSFAIIVPWYLLPPNITPQLVKLVEKTNATAISKIILFII